MTIEWRPRGPDIDKMTMTCDSITHDKLLSWHMTINYKKWLIYLEGHMTIWHYDTFPWPRTCKYKTDYEWRRTLGVKDPQRPKTEFKDWGHLFSRCSTFWHWLMTWRHDSRTATLAKTSTNMWKLTQDKFCIKTLNTYLSIDYSRWLMHGYNKKTQDLIKSIMTQDVLIWQLLLP